MSDNAQRRDVSVAREAFEPRAEVWRLCVGELRRGGRVAQSHRGPVRWIPHRAVIFPAFGFLLAVLLAEKLGLYYVQAVGVADLSKEWDVIITALAIGGGTKPLHDAIKRIEKAKEAPPTTT